jgi:hypothetical protein
MKDTERDRKIGTKNYEIRKKTKTEDRVSEEGKEKRIRERKHRRENYKKRHTNEERMNGERKNI